MNLLSRILSTIRGDVSKGIEDMEVDLLEANVSLTTIERLKEISKKEKDLRSMLLGFLKSGQIGDERVILLVGTNGSGKTTTAAKLAKWFKKRGRDVTVAAADTFRAGSIEQLEEWGRIVGFRVVKYHYGADPAAVAYEALKTAKDVVIIDTAGRQETRTPLMEELGKIKRVARPDLTLMVVDATQGVAALEQAKRFDESIGIDGFIVTKMDIDEKGGIILSLSVELEKPIYFISWGQDPDSFAPFSPEEYVDNLLGSS